MMRRVVSSLAAQGRFATSSSPAWVGRKVTDAPAPQGGIFGNGWDNASFEIVFRSIIKRPHIRELLKNHYAWATDDLTLDSTRTLGQKNGHIAICLHGDLSDPHRILKQFSIIDSPVIDIDGRHISLNGGPVFYDDDGTKIAIIDQGPVEVLAKEILWTFGYYTKGSAPEPKDARRFLEDLYGDVELTDDVLNPTGYLQEDCLLYPEDTWPEVLKGGSRYGKYQRGLGDHH